MHVSFSITLAVVLLFQSGCLTSGTSKSFSIAENDKLSSRHTSPSPSPFPKKSSPSYSNITTFSSPIPSSIETLTTAETTSAPDPLKQFQWYLENTGNYTLSVYSTSIGNDLNLNNTPYTGKSISIAVSDTGVEHTHPDLHSNFDLSKSRYYKVLDGNNNHFSIYDWTGTPTPTLDENNKPIAHGTAVSGIIGAVKNNGIGIQGIAPESKLSGFSYLNSYAYESQTKDQTQGEFDLFNYSYASELRDINNFHIPADYDWDYYHAGIKIGSELGGGPFRKGKGAIYVKSAGNEFSENLYATQITDNNVPYQIVVAALNANDQKASYSNAGSNIWISGYGGEDGIQYPAILTTDLQSCTSGYSFYSSKYKGFNFGTQSINNKCDYTSIMNGTSSAAPTITGSIALILEANLSLGWREVKDILAKTTKLPTSPIRKCATGSGCPPEYLVESGWTTNAAGFKFSNYFGFGKINVEAAINEAKNYVSPFSELVELEYTSQDAKVIPYFSDKTQVFHTFLESSLIIPDSDLLIIESIVVTPHITHLRSLQEVAIELISPHGTVSRILTAPNAWVTTKTLRNFPMLTNAFYGETTINEESPEKGLWKLKVIDAKPDTQSGELKEWKIKFYGHRPI